jgi:prepilin-type N-terminal cleavage/methylation domain-containing protein
MNMLNKPDSSVRGFTLVELMVTITIAILVGALTLPSMRRFMLDFQMRNRAGTVESIIRKTIAKSIAQGVPTRVLIEGDIITGEIAEDGVNFQDIPDLSYDINQSNRDKFSFTRTEVPATPWLQNTNGFSLLNEGVGLGTSMTFNRFGVPATGSVVYLEDQTLPIPQRTVVAFEILPTGALKVYHYEAGEWTR